MLVARRRAKPQVFGGECLLDSWQLGNHLVPADRIPNHDQVGEQVSAAPRFLRLLVLLTAHGFREARTFHRVSAGFQLPFYLLNQLSLSVLEGNEQIRAVVRQPLRAGVVSGHPFYLSPAGCSGLPPSITPIDFIPTCSSSLA